MKFPIFQRVHFAIFNIFLLAAVGASAQTPPPYLDTKAIEEEVVRLLQNRDAGELADELARQASQQPTTTAELLKKLMIYSRAGHGARVSETLQKLSQAADYQIYKASVFYPAQKAVGQDDLAARRIFYETIAFAGDSYEKSFVDLWLRTGDAQELESWLAARRHIDTWWQEWLRLKTQLGTADEAFAELEREIRTKPGDWVLIERYARNAADGENADRPTAWLADVVPADSAFDAYRLAGLLSRRNLEIAAGLYRKSLSLPFTAKDAERLKWMVATLASISPELKNPEKQLRFWTKKALADVYRRTNQPQLAQPLVEELTAMDKSDLIDRSEDSFRLAGQVQAISGQRVVESKILRDEAQNQDSPQYWTERAQYYRGRQEKELVWQTLVQALEKFPYKKADQKAQSRRLRILDLFRWYGANFERRKAEEIFRREFSQRADDKNYLFKLARVIDSDFEDLLDEFFTNKDFLAQILAARKQWRNEEGYLIGNVMKSEKWDREKRESVWNQLSVLALGDVGNRAFSLAEAMNDKRQYRKAIALLEECRKIAAEDYSENSNCVREPVEKELFDAYIALDDWRGAEKMHLGGFSYWRDTLGKIALAAAKSGDVADAVRLWKLNARLDRRNFWHLEELGKTAARPHLRDFYLEMKKRDSLTDVPDKALLLLR